MKIVLDGNELTARPGQTILDVARQQGIAVPTLCCRHEEPCSERSTSCLVCLVEVDGRFVPACATKVENGMVVRSETDDVRKMRRTSLELLLSDHVGDCYAPCQSACPVGLDIPRMLRAIQTGDERSAIAVIKESIPLPAVLGRICTKPCEKVCRRRQLDGSIAICDLKRHVADRDLAQKRPYHAPLPEPTGKRVLVVGAGPSGLSAAYFLAGPGHHVSLYALGRKPGGRLRGMDGLPESILDAEIRTILYPVGPEQTPQARFDSGVNLPITFYPEENLDWTAPDTLRELCDAFDAVLLCTGPCDLERLRASGLETEQGRLKVDIGTFSTSYPGVFAAGTVFRAKTTAVVRSVADGRAAARSIDRFLRTGKPQRIEAPFSVKSGKLSDEELHALASAVSAQVGVREQVSIPISDPNEAAEEAARCLHCDCRGRDRCLLLKHAIDYQARPKRFSAEGRMPLTIRRSGNILYEPGKCIKCGLCIDTAKKHGEIYGLTFLGRGFEVRVDVPFDEPLEKALEKSAEAAVRVCPTAALSRIAPAT